MSTLECRISSIVYSDKSTDFYILRVKPIIGLNATTVKGCFFEFNPVVGLKVSFKGKWVEDPRYGKQLNAYSFNFMEDKTRIGIISFLSSNITSIGPITAQKLYDHLGTDLKNVLDNDPERIKKLDFLTSVQSKAICDEWKKNNQLRTSAIFLTDLGFTPLQIRSIYKEFGVLTIQIVKKNPYSVTDCSSVGFQSADNAARSLGISVDDPMRVKSMILFLMEDLSRSEGHMWVTSSMIRSAVFNMFKKLNLTPFTHGEYMSDSHFFSALQELKSDGEIISKNDKLYLATDWKMESESAENIAKRIVIEPIKFKNVPSILKKYEHSHNIELSDEQCSAIMSLSNTRLSVITGFPGTGKTTLIRSFAYLFDELNLNYSLLSPTGIAAKRLSFITKKSASTIHRALGYTREGTWEFGQYNKYSVDAV
ncbi:MAG TPA: hypothetical protein ENI61_01730, partial [Ignavibacteria bacterium]|nr:hypothetical protein [Ignavibacteria bacterium]